VPKEFVTRHYSVYAIERVGELINFRRETAHLFILLALYIPLLLFRLTSPKHKKEREQTSTKHQGRYHVLPL